MKKFLFVTMVVIIAGGLFLAVDFYFKNFRGVGPTIKSPPEDISEIIEKSGDGAKNETEMPLSLPRGFSISVFAKDLPGARVMALDSLGNMWVSQTSEGIISLLEVKDGEVVSKSKVFSGLNKPHGLAFNTKDPFSLYIAEENKISRTRIYSEGNLEKVVDLPGGGRHFTRTILFSSEEKLLISVGSSCDVCEEKDSRRAKILVYDPDLNGLKPFASGLRNAVFMAVNPQTDEVWATEMGRDYLGDNLPPDEINIIKEGKNYGWPICYGKNIHDSSFDKNIYIRNPCQEPFEASSHIDIPAHSAPLGLAFFPKEGWPKEYQNDLLVSYHGSWNRTAPTGYKVVRYKLDADGNYLSEEDFISGWLTKDGALGRPVDILIQPNGTIYISDDKAGVIYKVVYGEN